MKRILLATLLVLLASAAQADPFDLLCDISSLVEADGTIVAGPETVRFRIDLENRKATRLSFPKYELVANDHPDVVLLIHVVENSMGDIEWQTSYSINRYTGHIVMQYSREKKHSFAKGSCVIPTKSLF